MPSTEPGPLTREVAALLRARMARFNVTGSDLAASVGSSQSQMSKILRGLKDLDIDLFERICWALDLDLTATLREAEESAANIGYIPTVGERFIEEGYRKPRERHDLGSVGDHSQNDDLDELALAADTENHSPDEDLRTP